MIIDFEKDIKLLKSAWGNVSIISKALTIISLLMSFMSIASLADNIFQFKGFIVTGIEFYRVIISKIFLFIRIDLPVEVRDFIVFNSFLLIPIIKTENTVADASNFSWFRIFLVYCFMITYPILLMLAADADSGVMHRFGILSALALILLMFINEPNRRIILFRTGIHVMIVIVAISTLAAISEGLSKPLES